MADNSIEGCGELQEASMTELNDVVGPMVKQIRAKPDPNSGCIGEPTKREGNLLVNPPRALTPNALAR